MLAALERASFDQQMQFLRNHFPREARIDPVLIGMDEESEEVFPEPLALWHRYYALTLDALTVAKPRAVGVDVLLPDRSFEQFVPGLDLPLARSLAQLVSATELVLVNTRDSKREWVPLHAPFRRFVDAEKNFGIDQVLRDPDTVARQFDEERVGDATFAGQLARRVGATVGKGFIDFSIGGAMQYVPMQTVVALQKAGDSTKLAALFSGKIVLIGSMQRDRDRWRLPVRLAPARVSGDDDLLAQPGVVIHAQVLRGLLGDGLITPLPTTWRWLIILAIIALLTSLPTRGSVFVLAVLVLPMVMFALSLWMIGARQWFPAATFLIAAWLSLSVRAIWDGVQTIVEKNRLKQSLVGSVSPGVLDEMLSGKLSTGVSAETQEICILFSDIRGFTGLAEKLDPDRVTAVLTRYFDRMVDCVHRHEGTLDKFMGDGMMVLFGAPRGLANPSEAALQCALDMGRQLHLLNTELAREGVPPLQIGIGINFGKAVVGNIGSTQRHNYSAIGDAVNVASRIEGLTKRLGTPIVITPAVKAALTTPIPLIAFGEQSIRGHSAMPLWGVEFSALPVTPIQSPPSSGNTK